MSTTEKKNTEVFIKLSTISTKYVINMFGSWRDA